MATSEPASLQLATLIANRSDLLTEITAGPKGACLAQLLLRAFFRVVDWETAGVSVSPGSSDAIIAFSLGTGKFITKPGVFGPGNVLPGRSNYGLASTILRILHDNPLLKVYTQWEIGDALTGFSYHSGSPNVASDTALRVGNKTYEDITGRSFATIHKVGPEQGVYLSTAGVAAGFARYLRSQSTMAKRVYVVCHPDHKKRCKLEVHRAFSYSKSHDLENISVVFPANSYYPNWSEYGCDAFAYDHSSTQKWTAARCRFIPTEYRHRMMALSAKNLRC
eukprot:TRINITY_DN4644_c0_g1_i3.p1 TRINITY_DN4644_c0_g1~~TRINITY_DN4644_c0_g1_i3.p1  ORF type:complete len:279 (+),score=22.95 TRINITY_DN4644_c0_g1_i3:550-1386(+)